MARVSQRPNFKHVVPLVNKSCNVLGFRSFEPEHLRKLQVEAVIKGGRGVLCLEFVLVNEAKPSHANRPSFDERKSKSLSSWLSW